MTEIQLIIFSTSLVIAAAGAIALAVAAGISRRWRDPQRLFTWEQKKTLLAQAGYRCEHKPLLWRRCQNTSRLEADHITPWSRGGATQLWNGQILCRKHNRAKSNLIPGPFYRWRLGRLRKRYAIRRNRS